MTSNIEPNNVPACPSDTRSALIATIVDETGTDWCAADIADALLAKWRMTPVASDPRTSDHE